MAIREVVQYPDPVLLAPTEPVKEIGARERVLVRDMIDTMYATNGVGLSANQIGDRRRVFVASPDQEPGKELVFFNPEIIRRSGRIREREGCLSVHEYADHVARYRRVTLRGLNLKGETVTMEAEGFLARIFQHETDHLDGKVFLFRLGWLKKKKVLKRFARR
ncbi:MAG: peptide deformylase [Candidatus Omnitrophica bacterium]|nr:peptide deformylase [Candidatus Omnitrophota bacterium]